MKNKLLLSLIVSSYVASTLVSCGGKKEDNTALLLGAYALLNSDSGSKRTAEVSFTELSVPETDEEKREVRATTGYTWDGDEKTLDGFTTVLRSGTEMSSGTFGQLLTKEGEEILSTDGKPVIYSSRTPTGSGLDHSSIQKYGDKLFIVTQVETNPGAIYVTSVDQDKNGKLTATDTKALDLSGIDGIWTPCAGSTSPWKTYLGSEEYEPDARKYEIDIADDNISDVDKYFLPMSAYFTGKFLAYTDADKALAYENDSDAKAVILSNDFNPYRWGYIPEVKITDEEGNADVTKHYSMGRFAHELAYVMPDKKTVYLSDDGYGVGFFMYVADEKEDLSSGRLYAAKWVQTSAKGAGSATLTWVALDSSSVNDSTIKAAIEKGVAFSDLFDYEAPTGSSGNETCSTEYTLVGHLGSLECLKLQSGTFNEVDISVLASRLESRRYASYMGATTEFVKEEGITFDKQNETLYVAMSKVSDYMLEAYSSTFGSDRPDDGDHIKLTDKQDCGAVYKLSIAEDETIGSEYVAQDMTAILYDAKWESAEDEAVSGDYDKYSATNECDVSSLASPDNVTMIQGANILIIGEDTDYHQNDYIWAYDTVAKSLTRIFTTPYGSETTSPYYFHNVGGHGYLMTVVQHPYGELIDTIDDSVTYDEADGAAYMGYIGPFPSFNPTPGFQY